MDTIALDFEDRGRMAFETLRLRAERIMERNPDDPEMWFFTDSDVLDVAETWTVSDMSVETCSCGPQSMCDDHADYYMLARLIEGAVKAMTGGGER